MSRRRQITAREHEAMLAALRPVAVELMEKFAIAPTTIGDLMLIAARQVRT